MIRFCASEVSARNVNVLVWNLFFSLPLSHLFFFSTPHSRDHLWRGGAHRVENQHQGIQRQLLLWEVHLQKQPQHHLLRLRQQLLMAHQDPGEDSTPGSPRNTPLSPTKTSQFSKQMRPDGIAVLQNNRKKKVKVERSSLPCRAQGDFKCT